MEYRLTAFLLRYRHALAVLSIALTFLIGYGAKNLYLEADYNIYFESDDPQRVAHEALEDTYTKTDNLAILLRAADGQLFTERMLSVIFDITEQGWQTPYVVRVDSITNFQHTSADGDDLLVEDLLLDPADLNDEKVAWIKNVVMNERQLVQRLVSQDGSTALVNVRLELPLEVEETASPEVQAEQRAARDASHPEVVEFGNQLIAMVQAEHPDIEMHLSGVSAVTNSFAASSEKDGRTFVPLMYGLILIALAIFLRSIGAIIGAFSIIGFASVVTLGAAGWIGYPLNAVNVTAPPIVLTIAVCDAVHLLSVYLRNLGLKMSPQEAMSESLRLNLQPVVLTSVTTAIGFLMLNFSVSPPFVELGNMTAAGVIWAMVLTFTLLPALTMLLVRKRKPANRKQVFLTTFANFVIRYRHKVLIGSMAVAALLVSFIPLNVIDDDPITYFKPGVPYRDAADFSLKHLPTVKDLNLNISCERAACVNEPSFLAMLESFQDFLLAQEGVEYVGVYADVLKRLNKSMNGDKAQFYKVPERSDLAAQYSLMYEMSLPYGLDLNNMVNLDKSATKISVLTDNVTNKELIDLAGLSQSWLEENYKPGLPAPSSVSLMFAHVGENNIYSMLWGNLLAVIAITFTILIALRSFSYAVVSMIPNTIPALMAFGIWGVLVGQVNMAVAAVFSIALGILVDDTVHFISKYRRARSVKGLGKEQSIHYAFDNVGEALIVTTIVLSLGFGVLGISDFNLNAMAGVLTMITIVIALIFDFLVLPPMLMLLDRAPDV